jgi:hypothetical protein
LIVFIDVSKPQFQTPSLVHPAVLDTMFHMLRASSQAFSSTSAINVNAWFSASGWQSPHTNSLRCWGRANVEMDAGEDGTIYVLGDKRKLVMSIEHIIIVAVSRPDEGETKTKKLLYSARW